jgi:hypothetical protein
MLKKIFPLSLVLMLILSACSFTITLPELRKVGPTVTESIDVPLPSDPAQLTALHLKFGAGKLNLTPGSGKLVSGTAMYNLPEFKPTVTVSGSSVVIEQGNWHLDGIPDLQKTKNEWVLALGTSPLDMSVEAGAYEAEFELGGLAISNLSVSDGAAKNTVKFSSPNLTEMALLSYETGASNVTLTGLGNANFANLSFSSGAGNYTLEFSGALRRDGSAHITTGVSNLTLVIPAGVPAQVTVQGALLNVSAASGFSRNGQVYTQAGSGYGLVILVDAGAGNLTITN